MLTQTTLNRQPNDYTIPIFYFINSYQNYPIVFQKKFSNFLLSYSEYMTSHDNFPPNKEKIVMKKFDILFEKRKIELRVKVDSYFIFHAKIY